MRSKICLEILRYKGLQRKNFALNFSLCDDRGLKCWNETSQIIEFIILTVMDRAYQQKGVFKEIVIHEFGRQRLRILLAAASRSETKVRARHDSDYVMYEPCVSVLVARSRWYFSTSSLDNLLNMMPPERLLVGRQTSNCYWKTHGLKML